jgi:protein TonB
LAYGQALPRHQKAAAMAATLLLCGSMFALLAMGLNIAPLQRLSQSISVIAVPISSPPPEKPAEKATAPRAAGKAAPANKQAKPAPLEAPKPQIDIPPPTPSQAAPKAGEGRESRAGASDKVGTGSGAGGRGNGLGAGGSGNGTGGGSRPIWRSGTIRDRDYPRSSSKAKRGGEVEVGFTIQPNGRVTSCHITKSSGDSDLDRVTCDLIEERFRFQPATNAAGDPISSRYGWRQSWWLEKR